MLVPSAQYPASGRVAYISQSVSQKATAFTGTGFHQAGSLVELYIHCKIRAKTSYSGGLLQVARGSPHQSGGASGRISVIVCQAENIAAGNDDH